MESLFNIIIKKLFKKETAKKGLNISSYLLLDYFFDFVLYYIMIRQFGPVVGGGSVMLLGLIIDLVILHLYDKSGKDHFGLEDLKNLRDYDGNNRWRIWISKTLKKGDLVAMVILAFYSNPCLTTIYMRPKDEKRRKMNWKDSLIFSFSVFIEISWIIIVYGFVLLEGLIRRLFDYINMILFS